MKRICIVLMIIILSSCNSIDESERIEGIYLAKDWTFGVGKLEFIGSKVSVYYNPTANSVFSSDYKIEGNKVFIENVPDLGEVRLDIIDDNTLKSHGWVLFNDQEFILITEEENDKLIEQGKIKKEKTKKFLKEESDISLKEILKAVNKRDSIKQSETDIEITK